MHCLPLHNITLSPPSPDSLFIFLLHNFCYFPSSILICLRLHNFIIFPPPPPPHLLYIYLYLFYIFFHPQIHRPPIDPISTLHRPHIEPTSTLESTFFQYSLVNREYIQPPPHFCLPQFFYSLLHNFIIFLLHVFIEFSSCSSISSLFLLFSLLNVFIPSSCSSSSSTFSSTSSFLSFSLLLLLLLIVIVFPSPSLPFPHFYCFPSKRPKRSKSGHRI